MFLAEGHPLSAACWPEALWAPLWVAKQGFKEAPTPCIAQAGWDDQRNESSHQPVAPAGKQHLLKCFYIWRWLSQCFSNVTVSLLINRCWELKHRGWLQQPPPSPLTSSISLMSSSPAMSFFNTSSSSVIGHTEHFSAWSPKSLQYNDNPVTFIVFFLTIWLQRQWWHWYVEFCLCQRGIKTIPVCTAVNSIPYRQNMISTNNICVEQSGFSLPSRRMQYNIKITVNVHCQFNYNITLILQTLQNALFIIMLFMYLFIYWLLVIYLILFIWSSYMLLSSVFLY